MILKACDYESLKENIDLDKITNIKFYYKKICAIANSSNKNLKRDAIKIRQKIKDNYPEYLL